MVGSGVSVKGSEQRFESVSLQEVPKRALKVNGKPVSQDRADRKSDSSQRKSGEAAAKLRRRRPKVLCIDDEVTGLKLRKELLELHGFDVLIAADGPSGLGMATQQRVDLVVLDYKMPGMDGGQVATQLRTEQPHLPILLLSAWRESIPAWLLATVDSFIEKGGRTATLIEEAERLTLGRAESGGPQ
jgi:CheY-like chemotaxis protein